LIEILIAMLILAVGLLGMASLQVRAVQDTTNSSFRSVAIYYANDMADRIRANAAGEAANLYTSVNGGSQQSACLTTTGCNSSAMATHDKWEWQQNLAAALPAGAGTLARAGEVYTVTVSWTDRVEQGATSTATSSVSLSFEP
jgi:type IV pilus assembly protein PilV